MMIKKRKTRIKYPEKLKYHKNENIIKTYSINGRLNIIEIKKNNSNENNFDDTEEII